MWPPELFRRELVSVRDSDKPLLGVRLILEEAFAGRQPVADLHEVTN